MVTLTLSGRSFLLQDLQLGMCYKARLEGITYLTECTKA